MPERQHAAMTEQQVERAGEQPEAERLHHEDGIEEERDDERKRHEDRDLEEERDDERKRHEDRDPGWRQTSLFDHGVDLTVRQSGADVSAEQPAWPP